MAALRTLSRVEFLPIQAGGDFAEFEQEWRDLEARSAEATPYLGYDWLSAWLKVYEPARAAVLRLNDAEGLPVMLGLIEQGERGRWRFGGYPVTSHRSLLCAAGSEVVCWHGFAAWLREHRRDWKTLSVEGTTAAASALPSARLESDSFFAVDLPASFESFVAERGSRTRRTFRQLLRRLEQDELEIHTPRERGCLFNEFVRLHRERADSLGEEHWQIDERLAQMLNDLCEQGRLTMPAQELVGNEGTIAVSILIDYKQTLFAYNIGVDCSERNFSPGILLLLEAVRVAIESGLERLDLGPGEYRYKHEFGARPVERYRVVAASPTLPGRALGLSEAASRELRLRLHSQGRLHRALSRTRSRCIPPSREESEAKTSGATGG